jgi:CTP synthase (UTP-ammonia lyase)
MRATSAGLADANSSEFDPATPHRVIYKLRELRGVEELGGTMRLGAWPCKIETGTLAHQVYGQTEISERHRHRYEFNREYEEPMVAAGCAFPVRLRTALMWRWSRFPASILYRMPVSSGIQVEAAGAASAVQGVHRRGL